MVRAWNAAQKVGLKFGNHYFLSTDDCYSRDKRCCLINMCVWFKYFIMITADILEGLSKKQRTED